MTVNKIIRKFLSLDKSDFLLFSGVLIYSIVFSYIALLRHHAYQSLLLDLGYFDQSFWTTLHGAFFYTSSSANFGMSQFGNHNSPILFIILPFYALFPYPETLLVVQSCVLALAAIPLYYLSKEHLGRTGALVICLAYFLYPPLHGVNLIDFHEFAFVPLILFTCFYYLFKKGIMGFLVSSCLALMIREDMALIIMMIALYGLIKKNLYSHERDRLILALIVLLSSFWLMMSLVVIIPAFNPAHIFSRFDLHYQGTGLTSLIFTHSDLKGIYLFELLCPLGFLSLLSPGILLTAVPSLVEILLSKYMYYSINHFYQALLIPAIFVSCIFSMKKIITQSDSKIRWIHYKIYGFILIFTIVSFLIFTPSPLSPVSFFKQDYTITQHQMVLDDVIMMIPPAASVSTQSDIGAHLAQRFELYRDYRPGAEYILIDRTTEWRWHNYHPQLLMFLDRYTLIYSNDGVELYKLKQQII